MRGDTNDLTIDRLIDDFTHNLRNMIYPEFQGIFNKSGAHYYFKKRSA